LDTGSGAVALLELLVAAARARVVATDVLQGVAYWLLGFVVAVRAVNVAVVMVVMVVMIVVAVRAMNMGLLGHLGLLRNIIAGNYLTTARQVQVVAEE
jgi:hypothetical protein